MRERKIVKSVSTISKRKRNDSKFKPTILKKKLNVILLAEKSVNKRLKLNSN
jgi:hypothetical protein